MSELEASEGKPNLVPMLDMVFQLITFFMLVINFKAGSLDRNLELPVVGSARPVDSKGMDRLFIINLRGEYVVKDGRFRDEEGNPLVERDGHFLDSEGKPAKPARQEPALMLYGVARTDVEGYIANEAVASRLAAGMKIKADEEKEEELPDLVVIRADRCTPFRLVYKVIRACQEQGYRRFALKGLNTRAEG
jgi:biopolymer transport protein ExbD